VVKNHIDLFGSIKNIIYICSVEDKLEQIIRTIGGYEVKELRYKPLDRLILGFVKCPIWGKKELHNGYIAVAWRRNGNVLERYGGKDREDLNLKIG